MICVSNIGQQRVAVSAGHTGAYGYPLYMNLGPGDHKWMMPQELKQWPMGGKTTLANYVQAGLLQVSDLVSVHVVNDIGHKPAPFGAFDLPSALDTAEYIRVAYNDHVVNAAVHSAADPASRELSVKPTDLLTLTAFITSLQGNYNAHIVKLAAHPVADALNGVSTVPGTLASNIAALRELYGRYDGHKRQCTTGTVLTPTQIITF